MSLQYWVGDFFVDLSRNQVTQKEQSQTIAPKALAVLTLLAENQGKVVSYDEIFDNVWPNTVVTPNTLQRSIAQLRKVLGENSKLQSYIKTHAKQGYSLECDVRWHDENDSYPLSNIKAAIEETDSQPTVNPSEQLSDVSQVSPSISSSARSPITTIIYMVSIIVIIGIIGYQYIAPQKLSQFSISELRTLTSTDHKEYGGIYSPDGNYVVFQRYSDEVCSNKLWAKNTKTQEEIPLTKNFGTYGNHSFSTDGTQLIFIQTVDCSQPTTQKKCYKLMSLDFTQAIKVPQSPNVLLECNNSTIKNSLWLNNNNIAFLQKQLDRWQLVSYSPTENKTHLIYHVDDGNIIDFDYSALHNLIALTRVRNDNTIYIELLNPDGLLISSHQIIYPPEIAKFRLIYPNFTPLANQLVFSTGRQLFTLANDGNITNISLPLDDAIGSPLFNPEGNKMLVIKGHYDSDIVSIPLSEIKIATKETSREIAENHRVERSIFSEDSAAFQPNGDLIAFISQRSGEEQLWVYDGNIPRQLSNFPMDSFIYGIDWATNGQSVLVNVHKELIEVFLDGSEKAISFQHPIIDLFQWDSINNRALSLVRINGIVKFAEIDLNNNQTIIIMDEAVNWALRSENGQLVYTDKMNRFWRSGPAEFKRIKALDDQGKFKQKFIIENNIIYGVNENFQLWSYSLIEDSFQLIGTVPTNVDELSDIKQKQLLMSVRISAKKEVAELILND
jgi:DNA-binding winged helix-turn-helix (wHTH) protein